MTKETYENEDYPLNDYQNNQDPVEEMLQDLTISDFVPTENGDLFVKNDDPDRPDMGSEEWSEWVLGQLRKDEYPNDRPTCDGLRRIAIKLFGPMDILPPVIHVCERSYAAVTCQLAWPGRLVCGSAEAHQDNCDSPYSQYPLGTAETRAISRALKTALNLRRVVTAEEGSRKADISVPVTDENREVGGITETQIRFIDLMCKQNDISVKYAVTEAIGEHEKLSELTNAESKIVQELLDDWAKEKPTDVEPYDSNWQSSF